MDVRIGNVGIDCADLRLMTDFWIGATGYVVSSSDDTYAYLTHPERPGATRIYVQRVPEPKVGKNRLHIDLFAPDAEATAERLVGLGATRLRRHDEQGETWVVLADPEGNEFCVVQAGG